MTIARASTKTATIVVGISLAFLSISAVSVFADESGGQGVRRSARKSPFPKRLSTVILNGGEVRRVYLSPGFVSIMQFREPVSDVKTGNPKDVDVKVNPASASELVVSLQSGVSKNTNMVVRCGRKTFVFDIVPSNIIHQDVIKVGGSFGSPELEHAALEGGGVGIIEVTPRAGKRSRVVKPPELIESLEVGS